MVVHYVGGDESDDTKKSSDIDYIMVIFFMAAIFATFMFGTVCCAGGLFLHNAVLMTLASDFMIAVGAELVLTVVVFGFRLAWYDLFGGDDDAESSKDFLTLDAEASTLLKQTGLNADFGKAFMHTEMKSIYNKFYDLLLFANASGLNEQATDIVAKYDKLSVIANGISRASEADILDKPSSKELLLEYLKQIKAFHRDLLELDKPYINKFVFELIKQNKFSYLPKHIESAYVDAGNKKLLELIKKDED